MIHIRRGVVRAVTADRPGAQELDVEVDGAPAPAIAYPDLCGEVRPGDTVLLNSTAKDLGLGTGGVHFVIAVEGRESSSAAPPGHVMKARYTPVQTAVASVEETHAALLESSEGLRQTPVVCAPLHSMVAPIAAGAKRAAEPSRRVRDDGRCGAGRRLLSPGAELARGRLARRMGHVRSGVRRRARSRDPVDGVARRQGGPGCRRHRRRRRAGEPGDRHHLGRERAVERSRPDGGSNARRQADPRAPCELRRRTGTTSRRLTSLPHDPGRRLQGRCERPGAGAREGGAADRGVGRAPIAAAGGQSTISSRWTDNRRSRSSEPEASTCRRWDAGSRTIPRSSSRPARPGCSPAGWPPRTAAGFGRRTEGASRGFAGTGSVQQRPGDVRLGRSDDDLVRALAEPA